MSINLQKGQKIDLTKHGAPGGGLRNVLVGLGWDEAQKTGFFSRPKPIDCDASVILCGAGGRVLNPTDVKQSVIYFGNLRHPSGAIMHMGDNLTGAGDGDDEQIKVDLGTVPMNIEKMVFVVNIYDGRARGQHFGMIKNAYIHLIDLSNSSEICRFNLSENYDNMTGLIVGEIYRYNGEWKFSAIGQPVQEASRLQNLIDIYR